MPLSAPATVAIIKPLPRALSLAAAAAAAATTSLLLISVVVSRAHSRSSSPPSTSASTTASLPPAPAPSPLPEHPHPHPPPPPVPHCPPNASHLTPCHDPPSGERHCPPLPPPPPHPPKDPPPHPTDHPHPPPPPHCRVPPPPGYQPPPLWPARRERARFANVDLLTVDKVEAGQDPLRARGEWLVFPKGVETYVEQLEGVLPLRGGVLRTALDVGCGVANFGNYLLSYGVLTMSIAPRERHGAQTQFALERGLPAMIGALGTKRLPYPSRSFDMVHCADCHVRWTANDGLYMLEIDRLLRPGGYWVMSGPPISWKSPCKGLNQTIDSLQVERIAVENIASKLCWKMVADKATFTVWRKPINRLQCDQELKFLRSPPLCTGDDPDSAWYINISMCITHIPRVKLVGDIAGGAVEKWPQRLAAVPPRIAKGEIKEISIQSYKQDSLIWTRRVEFYKAHLKDLSPGSYRNVMDMNADCGGFAAAMSKYPVWVMNVVPANITENTLGIIYERGLIGAYMNWCEAFSTYPRTYDLIHANGVFSLYVDNGKLCLNNKKHPPVPMGMNIGFSEGKQLIKPLRCGILDIMLEIDRILRPGGAVIIRDTAGILLKVKVAADQLQWRSWTVDTEKGASDPQKLLIVDNSLELPGS